MAEQAMKYLTNTSARLIKVGSTSIKPTLTVEVHPSWLGNASIKQYIERGELKEGSQKDFDKSADADSQIKADAAKIKAKSGKGDE